MATRPQKTRQKPTFRVPVAKPRNPFIALAKQRVAGSHRKPVGAVRAAQRQALRAGSVDGKDDGEPGD